jgi:hypothetical protein
LAVAVVAGVAFSVAVGSAHDVDPTAPDCVGQHVSMLAQEFGGMEVATEHHNLEHGTDWTVAEHLAHVQELCGP